MLSSNRPNKKNYEMILDAVSVLYQNIYNFDIGTGNGILGIKKRSLPGPCRIKQNIGGGPRLTLKLISIVTLFIYR